MDDDTQQVVYRLASTVLGSLAVLGSVLAVHAHRWLAGGTGPFLHGVTDTAVVWTLRAGSVITVSLCLAGLVAAGRRYYALCAHPSRELGRSAVSSAGVVLVGLGTVAFAPDTAFESLGLSFAVVGGVLSIGSVVALLGPVDYPSET